MSRTADSMDQQGANGQSLRNALQATIGLSNSDTQQMLSFVVTIDQQFAALDAEASLVIKSARAANSAYGLVAPPPAELAALQVRKTSLINGLKTAVGKTLTSQAADAIISYLARISHRQRKLMSSSDEQP